MNVLEGIARRGDDPYVRGAALVALGQTGLRMAAPILADGLNAADPVEAASAEHGVVALGRAIGEPALRAAFQDERRRAVLEPFSGTSNAFAKLESQHANRGASRPGSTT